ELTDSCDQERRIIEYFFHLGYKYEDIVNLLEIYHGISICIRTLKRRLAKNNLKKKNNMVEPENLRDIIQREMQGSGELSGYRKIWHILCINHHLHVPRKLVAQIVHDIDPEASRARKGNKLRRGTYRSYGPNHCWHIDGMFHSVHL
ncbi:Hypothetical predicted protein, partial [Paramuricea clavata]